jgi:hypothetical protein
MAGALATSAVLAGVLAAAPAASAANGPTPIAANGPGIYLFTGDRNPNPVHLTGEGTTTTGDKGIPSPVPDEIHTTPVDVNGTIVNYGTIMVGDGTIPSPYGSYAGQDYQGWVWSTDPLSAQLSWAPDPGNNQGFTVVQGVNGHFLSAQLVPLTGSGGAYATNCLSFQVPGHYPYWLQLNAAFDWVPVVTPVYGDTCGA